MRDEIDARFWVGHHDQFSEWIDGTVAAAGARLRRAPLLAPRGSAQLAAALVAVGLTVATLGIAAA